MRLGGLVLGLCLLAPTAGCFSPQQPGCAFSCAGDQLCPENYFCAGDGFCHRNDGTGTCTLETPDAAAEASTAQDAEVD